MTIDEALNIVVVKTGVDRYRWLCSDQNANKPPNDPATWQRWIMEEAQGVHEYPDITAHLAEASRQPQSPRVNPCGSCP